MKAYAAKLEGDILMDTVYSHPRGAMVNFLATRTNMVPKNDWADERIKDIFRVAEQAMNVCIVVLDVKENEVFDTGTQDSIS